MFLSIFFLKSLLRNLLVIEGDEHGRKKMLGVFLKEKMGNREHHCQDLRLMCESVGSRLLSPGGGPALCLPGPDLEQVN